MLSFLGRAALVTLGAAFFFLVAPGGPAFAASSAVLAVRVDAQPAGGAIVTVQFSGGTPKYQVLGAGTTEASILFSDTSIGQQVPPAIAGAPPVSSVTLTQNQSSAALSLHLTAATPVRVQPAQNAVTIFVLATGPAQQSPFVNPFGLATPAPAAGGASVTEVVMLKYADVSEIAGAIVTGSTVQTNDTFTPVNTNFGTSSSFGGGYGGSNSFSTVQQQPGATFGGFGAQTGVSQKVNDNIAVDRRLNAIILTGTQDEVDALKAIITKLDVPLPSVILETEILELSETSAKEIGLDFAPSGNGLVVNGSSSPAGYTIRSLQTGQGEINFGANLFAEIDNGNAKVLAKPRILAQSGVSASILTGDELPIITNIIVGGASTTVQQQVNYVNVGVNLQIQPRVTSDGFVTSHIFSEVSSVTSFVQGIPEISQRQAQTVATVHDGESFIIGGLLQDNEIHSLQKLPFIGDVPLLGTFFRHVTTSHTTTNLYILVTPHIVQTGTVATPSVKPVDRAVPAQFAPPPNAPLPQIPGSSLASPAPTPSPTTK